MNYQKNSFTLFETILALVILSILISSFFKILNDDKNSTYEDLVKVQNELDSNKTLSISKNFSFEKNN